MSADEDFMRQVLDREDALIVFRAGEKLVIEATVRNNDFDGLKFSDLVKITNHFKYQECDIRTSSYGGCETCGWGSAHTITLTLWKPVGESQ